VFPISRIWLRAGLVRRFFETSWAVPVHPETGPPTILAIQTQPGSLISGFRAHRPPCALGSNPDTYNNRSSDPLFWAPFSFFFVLLFGGGVQNGCGDLIIIAIDVEGTCHLSRRPHALPQWPACIHCDDFVDFLDRFVWTRFSALGRICSVARAVRMVGLMSHISTIKM
jgi:hypothetical protein